MNEQFVQCGQLVWLGAHSMAIRKRATQLMMYDTMTIHAAGSHAVGEYSGDEMRSTRVAVCENK